MIDKWHLFFHKWMSILSSTVKLNKVIVRYSYMLLWCTYNNSASFRYVYNNYKQNIKISVRFSLFNNSTNKFDLKYCLHYEISKYTNIKKNIHCFCFEMYNNIIIWKYGITDIRSAIYRTLMHRDVRIIKHEEGLYLHNMRILT